MATETTTPAVELAEYLSAVAEHLRAHPHLSRVTFSAGYWHDSALGLQVSAYRSRGEEGGAPAVLLWAKSMSNPLIEVRPHGDGTETGVWVTGLVGEFAIEVWDTDPGDISRWCSDEKYKAVEITLQQLTDYVAFGTVGVA